MTVKDVSFASKTTMATLTPTTDHNQVKRQLKVRQPTAEKHGNSVFSSKINELHRIAKLPSTNWANIKLTIKSTIKTWCKKTTWSIEYSIEMEKVSDETQLQHSEHMLNLSAEQFSTPQI